MSHGRSQFSICRKFIATSLCLILGCSIPLIAQEPSNPAALSLEELLDIKVYSASKYEQKVAEAPSSIVVISADDIRRYGYRTLMDVLATLPGFYVQGHGTYTSVGVRGFSPPGNANSRILLQINGHALNNTVDDSAPLDDSFPIDMDLIDRIEIVRGPSSSLYGADAFFAVVNVITRTGKDTEVVASGEGGSFGTFKETVMVGGERHGSSALISETYNLTNAPGQLDGVSDPMGSSSDRDQGRRIFALASSHGFTLQGAVSDLQQRDSNSATWCGACHQTDGHTTNFQAYGDLQYDRAIGDSMSFTARTYYDSTARHGFYNDLRGCSESSCHGEVYDHDIANGGSAGAEVKLTKRFAAGHRVTIGTEYRDNLLQHQQNWIDGFVDSHGGPTTTSMAFVDYNRTSHLWGFYGEAELRLLSKLILNLGVRNDRYNYVEAKTNPRVALIYNPRQSTTLKLLYGTAFRAPSFSEMYYADMANASAPQLRPETIRTEEIVFGQKLGKHTTIDASGFYNLIGSYIEQQTNIINGRDQSTFVNSKASAKGIEIELRSKLKAGLEGGMSYTYQDAEDPLNNSSLPDSPRNLAKMHLSYPLLRDRLTPSIEAQYQSRSLVMYPASALLGDAATGYSSPPVNLNFTLFSQDLWHGVSLSASVYNLVGRSLSDPMAGYFEQTRMVAAPSILPEDRRTFRIKLTWTSRSESGKREEPPADKQAGSEKASGDPDTHERSGKAW